MYAFPSLFVSLHSITGFVYTAVSEFELTPGNRKVGGYTPRAPPNPLVVKTIKFHSGRHFHFHGYHAAQLHLAVKT